MSLLTGNPSTTTHTLEFYVVKKEIKFNFTPPFFSIYHSLSPNFFQRKRLALVTTVKEDIAIAAPAIMGFNKMPNNGYNKPAATGILIVL